MNKIIVLIFYLVNCNFYFKRSLHSYKNNCIDNLLKANQEYPGQTHKHSYNSKENTFFDKSDDKFFDDLLNKEINNKELTPAQKESINKFHHNEPSSKNNMDAKTLNSKGREIEIYYDLYYINKLREKDENGKKIADNIYKTLLRVDSLFRTYFKIYRDKLENVNLSENKSYTCKEDVKRVKKINNVDFYWVIDIVEEKSNALAYVKSHCYFDFVDGRYYFNKLYYNISNKKNYDNVSKENILTFAHEILHALGFTENLEDRVKHTISNRKDYLYKSNYFFNIMKFAIENNKVDILFDKYAHHFNNNIIVNDLMIPFSSRNLQFTRFSTGFVEFLSNRTIQENKIKIKYNSLTCFDNIKEMMLYKCPKAQSQYREGDINNYSKYVGYCTHYEIINNYSSCDSSFSYKTYCTNNNNKILSNGCYSKIIYYNDDCTIKKIGRNFEVYGNDSNCFMANINNNKRAACLKRKIDFSKKTGNKQNKALFINISGEYYECPIFGGEIKTTYYKYGRKNSIYINCPKFNQFESIVNKNSCINDCNNNGNCKFGQCFCYDGFTGDYCEKKDRDSILNEQILTNYKYKDLHSDNNGSNGNDNKNNNGNSNDNKNNNDISNNNNSSNNSNSNNNDNKNNNDNSNNNSNNNDNNSNNGINNGNNGINNGNNGNKNDWPINKNIYMPKILFMIFFVYIN